MRRDDVKRLGKLGSSLFYFAAGRSPNLCIKTLGHWPEQQLINIYYHGIPPRLTFQTSCADGIAPSLGTDLSERSLMRKSPQQADYPTITFNDAYVHIC